MIQILMIIVLYAFSADIEVSSLYKPKKLPRDQVYEVMHILKDGKKHCVNQFLASHYKKSYWGIVETEIDSDCREIPLAEQRNSSEILKVAKTQRGLEFFLTENEKKHWKWDLWNFKASSLISLGDKVGISSLNLENDTVCEQYNVRCEEMVSRKCAQCQTSWQVIVGSGCLEKNSKICQSDCGGRDKPACSQGLVEQPLNLVCPHQKRGALCHENLSAYCFENVVYCK